MKEGPEREMNVSWALWTVSNGLAGEEIRRYLRSEVFEGHVRLVGVCSGCHCDCDDWRELCSFRVAGFNGRDGLKMVRLFFV